MLNDLSALPTSERKGGIQGRLRLCMWFFWLNIYSLSVKSIMLAGDRHFRQMRSVNWCFSVGKNRRWWWWSNGQQCPTWTRWVLGPSLPLPCGPIFLSPRSFFPFLLIDINYFLENTTTTSNRQRIITISFQPRQDALPLYEIASSSTVYGFYSFWFSPSFHSPFFFNFHFKASIFNFMDIKRYILLSFTLVFFLQ